MAESHVFTDDERMRAALELASGHPSPAARAMGGAFRAVGPRWSLAAAAAAAAAVFVAGHAGRGGSAVGSSVSGWRESLGWVFSVAAAIGVAVLVTAVVRSGTIGRFRSSPLHVLTPQQREQLRQQINGEDAIVAEQLPLTRLMVADSLRLIPAVWWWVPTICVFLAGVLRSDRAMTWAVVALIFGLSVKSVVRYRTRTRHLRTFLDLHPTTTTAEATP